MAHRWLSNPRQLAGMSLASLALAACAGGEIATAPDVEGPLFNEVADPSPQVVTLCKIGEPGTTADFTISATGGTLNAGGAVTLQATTLDDLAPCVTIWSPTEPRPNPDPTVEVTVTEVGMTPGTQIDRIVVWGGMDGEGFQEITGSNQVTVRVNYDVGATIFFKNSGTPEQPGGGQGCTPGYWRQPHHFDSWPAPYTPTTAFGAVFANAFPGRTLHQVVTANGGGLNALGRHTVAALLNAASGSVSYDYTVAEVIAAFNAAYASGDYETTKDRFEAANEQGCPLD